LLANTRKVEGTRPHGRILKLLGTEVIGKRVPFEQFIERHGTEAT
jgi:hypothetical protein